MTNEEMLVRLVGRVEKLERNVAALEQRLRDSEVKRRRLKKRFDALEVSYDYRMSGRQR